MLRVVLLLGVVSMLGDIVYEGMRSVLGPFFKTLGVTPVELGLILGTSELLGYVVRPISGYVTDKTGRYWALTFVGYALVLAIPFMAFPRDWKIIALLVIVERLGKGLRGPARDTILSFVTRGLGFGIHELFDQIGAVLGPAIFFLVLSKRLGYRTGFYLMFVPSILLLTVLALAYRYAPKPKPLKRRWEGSFGLYALFVFFSFLGFVNFQFVAYHMKGTVPDAYIPLLYAIAMALDGLTAPAVGWVYDRIGLKVLTISPILFSLVPLSFLFPWAIVVYGICLAFQETVMRVAVADLVEEKRRGISYGLLYCSQGAGMFLGNLIVGYLYNSVADVFAFVIISQALALVIMKLGTSGSWRSIRLSL